jgi:hypothetical protein
MHTLLKLCACHLEFILAQTLFLFQLAPFFIKRRFWCVCGQAYACFCTPATRAFASQTRPLCLLYAALDIDPRPPSERIAFCSPHRLSPNQFLLPRSHASAMLFTHTKFYPPSNKHPTHALPRIAVCFRPSNPKRDLLRACASSPCWCKHPRICSTLTVVSRRHAHYCRALCV